MKTDTTTGAALPPRPRHERQTSGGRSSPLGALHCTGMIRSAKNQRRRLPKMGRHSSGQARVTLNGKVHYLGAFGSPEAHQRYAELIQRWLAGGRQPLAALPHPGQVTLTVREMFEHYRAWILTTGRYAKNGAVTPQRGLIERSLSGFETFVGHLRVTQLTEAVIVQWRDRIELNRRLTRGGVNRKVQMLLGALRWAKTRGLQPKNVWADCRDIEPPPRRSDAADPGPDRMPTRGGRSDALGGHRQDSGRRRRRNPVDLPSHRGHGQDRAPRPVDQLPDPTARAGHP